MLCISLMTNAQSLKGVIVNSEDSLPISGAHIYVPNSSIGTVSNAQGVFTLSVHPHGDVNLKVSCVGFEGAEIDRADSIGVIYLKPDQLFLSEVTIFSEEKIKSILAKAIKEIPHMNTASEISMHVFYRELLKQDNRYVRLTDAVFAIHQSDYSLNTHRDTRLLQSRVSEDLSRDVEFETHPSRLLVKLRVLNFPDDFLDIHDFNISLTTLDSKEVYAIEAIPKKEFKQPAFNGIFYLLKENLQFIGYDLKVSTDHLQYFPEQKIRIKYNGKKIKAIARITNEVGSIRYFKYQDNWFVRNIDNEVSYDILNDRGETLTTFDSFNKVIVYDMSPIDNLATGQKVNIHKEIKPSSPYSPEFWDALHVLEYTEVESQVREDLEKKTALVNQFEQ